MRPKTLVMIYDISQLDDVAFTRLLQIVGDAPVKAEAPCLTKFNVYDHSHNEVFAQLDPLHEGSMQAGPGSPSSNRPLAGARCLCPMCEHHRDAELVDLKITLPKEPP